MSHIPSPPAPVNSHHHPFKVVFLAYIIGILSFVTSSPTFGDWSDGENRDAFAKATRARCIGIITNSLMLAVFRF